MPDLICNICGGRYAVANKDYKLLGSFSDKVCSADCLISRIKLFKRSIYYNTYTTSTVDYGPGNWWSFHFKRPFRSQFEELVALLLFKKDINFVYESYTFFINGVPYTPDFYVEEFDCFLEVKGVWTLGKKKKMEKFLNAYPDINYLVVPWPIRDSIYSSVKEAL